MGMTIRKLLSLIVITGIALVLITWTFASFEFRSLMFAFLINWLIMSWVAILGQLVTLPLFPAAYYHIKPFEQSGRVYEQFGVALFKKIVRCAPFTILSPTLRFPAQKTRSTLRPLENEMCKAETAHLVIFLIMLALVGYALLMGWLDAAAWLVLFNVLFNGYPVLLQRYNRSKIEELIRDQIDHELKKY
jgi:hypothetical protein